MNSLFYATLSLALPDERIFCLAISARDMIAAMDQTQAWISGFTSATEQTVCIYAISSSKPRGLEAQTIHNFVKVPA